MKYRVFPTRSYKKDYKRLRKSGYDLEKLNAVVDLLASSDVLPPQFRDHALHGVFAGSRECHIGPDWLLRYMIDNRRLILVLMNTGTHRDVLGIE